jgi:hypothetical protein
VADQTHRDRGGCELSAMAVGTGFMAGKTGRGGVVGAFVTRVAGKRAVPRAFVQKLRVIQFRPLDHR